VTDQQFIVAGAEVGQALSGVLRAHLAGAAWSQVKALIASGKVFVAGTRELDAGRRLAAGDVVEVRMRARRAEKDGEVRVRLVFDDAHVVVIDKPSGVSSVPYEAHESGTALDLVRDAWRQKGLRATETALHVVHRIDKETSGLLVFAKSKKAERALAAQFRAHTVARTYLCVAHGQVRPGRIESRLCEDRGDGLRGSTRFAEQGKRAVTHVEVLRTGQGASLCQVRLETGKTHQIRIHLAERGHPLVGERVYVRDHEAAGRPVIEAPRLLLHAATLGFAHPLTGAQVSWSSPLPEDFVRVARALGLE
jgi:23S rRNA pseudouridine1911/1915/1917 synthase